jgi:hypothetical protein
MRRNILLALVVLASLGPAWAADEDAPDPGFKAQALKEACDPPGTLDLAARDAADRTCQAYLRGVADGLFMLGMMQQSRTPICLPEDGPVSPAEAKSELEDYLADHPEAADHSAGLATAFAIVAAHPCE